MVVEQEIRPLLLWLFDSPLFGDTTAPFGAVWVFGFIVWILIVLGLLIGLFRNLIQYGMHPGEALQSAVLGGVRGVAELFKISWSRLYAMSWLSFQESIRNWSVVAFIVFMIILGGLGWYLDTKTDHPARLYLTILLTLSNILLIVLALFLSVFSLPRNIEDRTIYTVVTKPVYSAEIVLGRILGFGAVGTLMLLIMGLVSYVFVNRGLDHSHMAEKDGKQTTLDDYHRHTYTVNDKGEGFTNQVREHYHAVHKAADGSITVGPPEGNLLARVPVYGTMRFLGRDGKPAAKGINVGQEWTYRGYVEGGTGGAAIWTFPVSERMFPADQFPEIPVEMTLRIFRTYKGNIEEAVRGNYKLKRPGSADKTFETHPRSFACLEFQTQQLDIPRKLPGVGEDGKARDLDLLADLAPDGYLELHVACSERAQYFGMAQADVYLRAAEGWFFVNFIKGHISIWISMMMVIGFGVMFSTFVNAPIALLATLATLVLGYFRDFIIGVATGTLQGGGPIESGVRFANQQNLIQEFDQSPGVAVMQGIDLVLRGIMYAVAQAVPAYSDLGTVDYVAYGFDIPWELLIQRIFVGLAFVFITGVIGFLFLRGREIAA